MKILIAGILFVCLNTFAGSSFDAITKYSSLSLYKWYHYYAIGGTGAIILFFIFISFIGGMKKHLVLEKKYYYFLPIIRGVTFIPVLLIVFFSLKNIPISLFTMLLMTSPFFLLIFAKLVLKEKLNILSWIAIIIGFCGVIIVLRPTTDNLNIFIFLILFVSIYNAFSFTIVGKYPHFTSFYGYTFYNFAPFILFSYFFFIFDPLMPPLNDFILFIASGVLVMISMLGWTAAYHVAGKYSSIISPFFFTQIIWASLYGYIFFSEVLDSFAIIGITIIVISGTVAIYNRSK